MRSKSIHSKEWRQKLHKQRETEAKLAAKDNKQRYW